MSISVELIMINLTNETTESSLPTLFEILLNRLSILLFTKYFMGVVKVPIAKKIN